MEKYLDLPLSVSISLSLLQTWDIALWDFPSCWKLAFLTHGGKNKGAREHNCSLPFHKLETEPHLTWPPYFILAFWGPPPTPPLEAREGNVRKEIHKIWDWTPAPVQPQTHSATEGVYSGVYVRKLGLRIFHRRPLQWVWSLQCTGIRYACAHKRTPVPLRAGL